MKYRKGDNHRGNADKTHGWMLNVDHVFVQRRDTVICNSDSTTAVQKRKCIVVASTENEYIRSCC